METTYLRDNGELGAEVVQANLGDLHVVDGDLARRRLQQPEEAQRHRRLARSGATNDANLGGKHSVIGGIGDSQRPLAPAGRCPTFSPPLTLSESCLRTRSSPSL